MGTEILEGLCPAFLWKTELVNDELKCLAEISKQSVEGMACRALPVAYRKM